MTNKEIALKTIEDLPDDATWDVIQDRINFVAAVRRGIQELNEGQEIPHVRVREEFAGWLTT